MPKIALIEYFTAEEKTFIFVVRPGDDKPIVHEAHIKEAQIKEFMQNLLNPEKEKLSVNFHKLSELLVQPFLEDVKEYDTIYLVPHGWLHYLPLHALKCGDGKYLIEKHKIVYSPSATVIKYCQAKNYARQKNGENKTGRNCLALGVGKKDDKEEEHKLFHKEAELVANTIFKGTGTCKIDKEASKDFFKKECTGKDVIHIACHGHFDREQPLKSGLVLSNGSKLPYVTQINRDAIEVPEDMLLTAEEIFNIELNADLVTLSACVTGVNDNKPGDELIGLTRALIYAGTPSVIVTLWPVHSESALQLMESFYRNWMDSAEGNSKAEALQKAQLEMIGNKSNKKWQDPFFWAPFILVGDWL
jgi:CHAT domain-containing protein